MFHMLVSSLAALLLMLTIAPPPSGLPSFRQFRDYADGLVLISLCTWMNVFLNNYSLTLVSLFVNQIIKASSPVPTIVLEGLLAKRRYTLGIVLSVLAICVGSAMAPYYKIRHSDMQSTALGVVACVVSMLASSLKPVVAMVIMSDRATTERPKLAPELLLFYDCMLSFCFFLLHWLCSWERPISIAYLSNAPVDAPYMEGHDATWVALGIIATGSLMAFGFNLAVYYFVMLTSALTSTIGSNAVKIVIIFVAALQDSVNDAVSWSGIAVVATSTAAYVYFTFTDQRCQPQQSPESMPLKE